MHPENISKKSYSYIGAMFVVREYLQVTYEEHKCLVEKGKFLKKIFFAFRMSLEEKFQAAVSIAQRIPKNGKDFYLIFINLLNVWV